jgi:endonuclease YncB( thermonuclease family)
MKNLRLWLAIGLASIATALSCTGFSDIAITSITCPDCPVVPVERVVDGDTLDSAEGRIRLFGVDTPERGARCFAEATKRLTELAGDSVRVEAGPRQGDGYGRRLYYVYTEAGDSIDETLLKEGLGLAWIGDGQHRDVLVAAQMEAEQRGVGCLW